MHRLSKKLFAESDVDLPEIQSFDCGTERWGLEVSTWIKSRTGSNSVIQDMQQFHTKVWLYRTQENDLVGFASWGETTWSYPPPKGKKTKINYIPYMAVHKKYWGEPKGADKNDQYAYQIIDDIIEYCAKQNHLFPVIGLSVDQGNVKAIKFYTNRGFVMANTSRQDKLTAVVYERMFLNIESLVASPDLQQQGGNNPPLPA